MGGIVCRAALADCSVAIGSRDLGCAAASTDELNSSVGSRNLADAELFRVRSAVGEQCVQDSVGRTGIHGRRGAYRIRRKGADRCDRAARAAEDTCRAVAARRLAYQGSAVDARSRSAHGFRVLGRVCGPADGYLEAGGL